MTEYLTDEEVRFLTGKRRFSAQVRVLVAMGRRFELRPDGKPIVYRDRPAEVKVTPKWDAA